MRDFFTVGTAAAGWCAGRPAIRESGISIISAPAANRTRAAARASNLRDEKLYNIVRNALQMQIQIVMEEAEFVESIPAGPAGTLPCAAH